MKRLTKQDIAPCGMNCGVCIAYLRDKNNCPGCRIKSLNKPSYCVNCVVVNCKHLAKGKSGFCYDCEKFPCKRIKQLDKRYISKYGMSMIENLQYIKLKGVRDFLKWQTKKYKCAKCGSRLSTHRWECTECKTPRPE